MPANSQKTYFALRALNVEIASIKEKTHGEPGSLALQLRMQWWRDAVAEIYGDVPSSSGRDRLSVSCWHSPIVRGLYRALQQSQPLTRRFLERLIDARQADLDILERATLQETVDYAEESVSSLLYLSLELLGVQDDVADEVASHAGVGIGVTTALRAVPWQNGATVPTELLRRPDSSIVRLIQKEGAVFATEQDEQVWQQAIAEMVDTAAFHLARAQALQSQVPRAGRLALLPVVPAMHYLEALAAKGNNVLQPDDAAERRLGLLLRMGRTWLTGVF
jgi:NADH dehydrogenase [ubiquinone] 1 alpha subcomplex assembly factor 6